MTLYECIKRADAMKPNVFSNEDKTAWINGLEGRIRTEVWLLAEPERHEHAYTYSVSEKGITFTENSVVIGAETDFRVGEEVTVAGCTEAENNGAAEIAAISENGKVLTFTEKTFLPCTETGVVTLFADHSGDTLLVAPPYDDVYPLYLAAMIDFAHGEYTKYQNSYQLYNAMFGAYVRWFAKTYEPAQGYNTNVPRRIQDSWV